MATVVLVVTVEMVVKAVTELIHIIIKTKVTLVMVELVAEVEMVVKVALVVLVQVL